MEPTHLLAMRPTRLLLFFALLATALTSCQRDSSTATSLTVAISPYQDIAMLVNAEPLGLEEKYGLDLVLQTMAWEEILPALASRGRTVDVGFGSLVEYLTKERGLNKGSEDPLLFVFPVYVYKGGSFVTLKEDVPSLVGGLDDPASVRRFFDFRIGAQRNSIYEMMLFSAARRHGLALDNTKILDIAMNDGLLAVQNGDLDVTAAGLTQLTEIERHGGRRVLTMESMGFADLTGFVCRQSTLEQRRADIEKLLAMWFDSVAHVFGDLERNSEVSLKYLRENASTNYSLDEYRAALEQEFFPRSIDEAKETLISPEGLYSIGRISSEIIAYLLELGIVAEPPSAPKIELF